MTATEYANGLRLLADWFDAHPEVETPGNEISVYGTDSKENAALTMRALTPCAKKYTESIFSLSREFGPIMLRYVFMRNAVCTPRVVGQREVEAKVIPAKFEPERFIEAHTEDIIEWDCEPILAPKATPEAEVEHEPV